MKSYLLFALAGYAIGSLYAPKKGTLLRKEIRERVDELQKKGAQSLEAAQLKSEEIVDKASVLFDKAKEQATTVRCRGEKMARSASAKLQVAFSKARLAVYNTSEKTAATTGPVVSQLEDQARDLKKRVDDFFIARNVRRISEQIAELNRKSS